MAECIVGDITPSDGLDKQEKHKREKVTLYILEIFNLTHCYWCRLLITFANSLDPDQARQNAKPDKTSGLICIQTV